MRRFGSDRNLLEKEAWMTGDEGISLRLRGPRAAEELNSMEASRTQKTRSSLVRGCQMHRTRIASELVKGWRGSGGSTEFEAEF
ncbi:uncharacterized [Tachysurus ichikawai]